MVEHFSVTHLNHVTVPHFEIFTLRWNLSGEFLALGSSNSLVQLLTPTFDQLQVFTCQCSAEKMPITSLRYRPDFPESTHKPSLLATTSDGGVVHWNLIRNKVSSIKRLRDEQIYTSDYSLDGSRFVLGCKDSVLRVFDQETHSEISAFHTYMELEAVGASRVFCVKWFEEHLFVSGGWNDKVTIWDNRVNRPVREMLGPHICGDAIDVKGNLMVTASYDIKNQVDVWDWTLALNLMNRNLQSGAKKCMPYCTQFCKGDKNIVAVTGAGVEEVYFLDVLTGVQVHCLTGLKKSVFSMHVSMDNKLALGLGSIVEIYQIS